MLNKTLISSLLSTLCFVYTSNTLDVAPPDIPQLIPNNQINLTNYISSKYSIDDDKAYNISSWIIEASDVYDIPMEKLAAVVAIESSFRDNVRSGAGAYGLAQINRKVWKNDLIGEIYDFMNDPRDNVFAGAHILSLYKEKCGGWECAIKAYNVGITMYRMKKNIAQHYNNKVINVEQEIKNYLS